MNDYELHWCKVSGSNNLTDLSTIVKRSKECYLARALEVIYTWYKIIFSVKTFIFLYYQLLKWNFPYDFWKCADH